MKRKTTSNLPDEIIQVAYGRDYEMLKSIISPDNLECRDKDGRTILIHSVLAENLDLVSWLCSIGADPNQKDKIGWTSMHYAVQKYHGDILEILINKGGDINAKDEHGNTALWRAVFESKGRGELIKKLLHHGADPYIKNNYGVSPLELADSIANYNVKQFFK